MAILKRRSTLQGIHIKTISFPLPERRGKTAAIIRHERVSATCHAHFEARRVDMPANHTKRTNSPTNLVFPKGSLRVRPWRVAAATQEKKAQEGSSRARRRGRGRERSAKSTAGSRRKRAANIFKIKTRKKHQQGGISRSRPMHDISQETTTFLKNSWVPNFATEPPAGA